MASDTDDPAVQAVLSEFEYVCSMIRMYRELQMQAVGIAVLLYTAVLALFGSTLNSNRLVDVLSNCTALLSYLVAIVVLAYAVMEIRIRRASLYIWRTLSPKVQELLKRPPGTALLLEWERAPGVHLPRFQRVLSSSTVFVVLIALPSLGAAVWHVYGGLIPRDHRHPAVTIIGAILLLAASFVACRISIRHELRGESQPPLERAAA